MSQKSLTILLSAILCACIFMASPGLSATSSRFESSTQNMQGVLEFASAPLKSMQAIPFTLTLSDAEGTTLQGLTLRCDLTMPAMAMPPNQPKLMENSGNYSGTAIFTMAGAWQANFTGEDQAGQSLELTFDIPDVMMK